MVDIEKLFHLVEKRPGIATGEKKVAYLSHYFAGIFAEEAGMFISQEYINISQWIYNWSVKNGYKVEMSIWWHDMIYEMISDEDGAWNLLFEIIHGYFEVRDNKG